MTSSERSRQQGNAMIVAVVLVVGLGAFAATGSSVLATSQHGLIAWGRSTQSLYAAEAGLEMALMEYASNSDQDSDGTIGSISDDGNANNDLSIGGATVSVTFSANTFVATGATTGAQRVLEVTVE